MNDKNLPLGEAYRLTIREAIDRKDGKKIIRDAIKSGDKEYPPKDWKKKYE